MEVKASWRLVARPAKAAAPALAAFLVTSAGVAAIAEPIEPRPEPIRSLTPPVLAPAIPAVAEAKTVRIVLPPPAPLTRPRHQRFDDSLGFTPSRLASIPTDLGTIAPAIPQSPPKPVAAPLRMVPVATDAPVPVSPAPQVSAIPMSAPKVSAQALVGAATATAPLTAAPRVNAPRTSAPKTNAQALVSSAQASPPPAAAPRVSAPKAIAPRHKAPVAGLAAARGISEADYSAAMRTITASPVPKAIPMVDADSRAALARMNGDDTPPSGTERLDALQPVRPAPSAVSMAPVRSLAEAAPRAASPVGMSGIRMQDDDDGVTRYRRTPQGLAFDVATTVNGSSVGKVSLLIRDGENISIRLTDLLAAVQPSLDPALYQKLADSQAAQSYMTFNELREAGIAVRFNDNDRLILGIK